MVRLLGSIILWVVLATSVCAQLDRIHWLPPVMTDTTNVSSGNTDNHFVVITTPSAAAVPYTIRGGNGQVIQSGTVSNSAPVNFQIANNVGNNIVPTVAGQSDHHVGVEQLNQVTDQGIVVEADEPVYVNIRQRSTAQGASLTSKGCAALGTEFRVGTMRNRLSRGQNVRNDFFSIMATEDNTVVTIDEIKPGMIFTGRTDTTPVMVTLNRWESYTVGIHHPQYPGTADVNDIDGTRVTATEAITLVSGTYLGSPTSTGSRDAGFDQPASTARAGTEYILVRGAANANSILESPQVVVTEPDTNIFVNGNLTPVNASPLQPGDYFYLDNRWSANGTMFVETSEPTMMYQTTAGSNSAATPGFSFIPPLSTDITNTVDNIAQIQQIGSATLRVVTTTGSTITFNGNTPQTGPLAIAGNPDWVLYTQGNITGNVSVQSTGPVAASVLNLKSPVGAAGYFSGFPEFKALIEIVSTSDCLPGLELRAVDPSGALIQSFEWFNGDGSSTGVTGETFTPTVPGDYFVRSFLTASAPCAVDDSAIFTVRNCPVADMSISKSVPQDPLGPGGVATFTLAVTNAGPDVAEDVQIEDILPAGFTYVANSISGADVRDDASPSGSGLRWLINEMAVGSVNLTFQATRNATGATLNTATVETSVIDNDLTNNQDSADIVEAVPGISATKALDSLVESSPGVFVATFTSRVRNTGNEPIANLQITDALTIFPNDFPSGSTGQILADDLTAASWNGNSVTDLLAGSDVIPVGESRFVTFQVTFTLDATTPYCNQARVTGRGQLSGEAVAVVTDDPSTPAADDCTQVIPNAESSITLSKTTGATTDNGGGSFTTIFQVVIENTGNDPLGNLVLSEDLSGFPAGATFTNSSIPTTLLVGQEETITVDVTYTPDSTGPYTNLARINADGTLSGDAVEADDEATILPPLNSSVSISKTLTGLVDNGGGDFTATFSVVTTNTGNEPLSGVTVTDDLGGFPAGATIDSSTLPSNVSLAPGVSDNATVVISFAIDATAPYANTATVAGMGAFTGDSVSGSDTEPVSPAITPALQTTKSLVDTIDNQDGSFTSNFTISVTNTGNEPLINVNLTEDLSGFPTGATADTSGFPTNASLAVGDAASWPVSVTYTPTDAGPYSNSASASAEGQFSMNGASDSVDSPVNVPVPLDAAVTIDKALSSLTDNGDGTFTARFTLTLTNTGNEPLRSIQVSDALLNTPNDFPSGTTSGAVFSLTGLTAATVPYNGTTQANLLSGNDTLAVNGIATAEIDVTFTPDGNQPFSNTAQVSAVGSFTSSPESDISNTVEVNPPLNPALTLTKVLDGITDDGGGMFTATFTLSLENTGNENLNGVQISDAVTAAPSTLPASVTLSGTPILSSNVSATTVAYDPISQPNFLSGNDTLEVGEVATVTFSVSFSPDGTEPYNNQASALGKVMRVRRQQVRYLMQFPLLHR